ncbi:MAG: DUF3619 family protein [Rubrivivax sp.]|nr:DUF3619 family protein [Rubrivivax sp.]
MTSARSVASQLSLEARLAARIAGALSLRSQALPNDITERLRVAREQAISRARALRLGSAAAPLIVGESGGTAVLGRLSGWWQRAASVLPLIVLVSGLLMIDRWAAQEQVLAAAEIDAQLLSDSLPPAAYSDPGFGEFLRAQPTP